MKDPMYWHGVGKRFDKANKIAKIVIIPTAILFCFVIVYFN